MKPPFPFLRLLPSSSNPFLSLLRLCRPPPPTSAALSSHFSLPPRHILSPLTLSAMSSSPPLDDAIRADSSSPPAAVEKRAEEISADERRDEELKAVKEEREKRSEYMVEFAVSDKCKLKIDKGDITKWFVDGSSDAIVNAANERMLGGSGVDGAIHRAAGPRLREACYEVPEVYPGVRCPTGEARITPGFRLRASHVIHTVGPVYDEEEDPEALLKSAYRNSLSVAKEHNIQYVAFPAISCGVYGYPYDEAASIAISTIKEFANDFKEVHFVLFLDDIYGIWLEKAEEILGSDGSIAKENAESDGSVAKEIAGNDGSTLKKTSGTNGSVAKNVAGSDGSVVKDVVGSNESVTKDVAGKEGSAAEIVGNEGSSCLKHRILHKSAHGKLRPPRYMLYRKIIGRRIDTSRSNLRHSCCHRRFLCWCMFLSGMKRKARHQPAVDMLRTRRNIITCICNEARVCVTFSQ